jgi:hypothetical protein
MNDGLLADCFPALKILAILFVFVSSAAYTTVKQNPAQNLRKRGNGIRRYGNMGHLTGENRFFFRMAGHCLALIYSWMTGRKIVCHFC